jgi:hypothetical protein
VFDFRDRDACREAVKDARYVFNLAADMGGMGFIETSKALCMLSVLINTNLLLAAQEQGIERYFFASSACVYAGKQTSAEVASLRDADAYPGDARGRLRLGETLQRASVPPLLRGLRIYDALPATTTSSVRTARTTAAGRKRPLPSVGRSSRPSSRAAVSRS